MRPTLMEEIRRAVHGRWLTVQAETPVHVEGVSIDSRKARDGELFIAIRGDNHDGHDYLAKAAAAGCVAAIVAADRPVEPALAARFVGGLLGVADTTVALGELAALHRQRLATQVIAVTGSVGKTTVKRMIDHILKRKLKGFGSPKSFNNNIGVPLTLLAAGANDDYIVCELGTNAPGEIATLTAIARPDLAVITAVGPSHLAGLGSVERIAIEKAAVLGGLSSRGVAVVTADSEELSHAVRAYPVRAIRFGLADDAELRLTDVQTDGLALRFQINNRLWVELPLPGKHNALNALAAMATAMRLGFSETEAAEALADCEPAEMRMQAECIGPVTLINDAYNANPMSMAAAVAVLAGLAASRRVFVAGDMLELGEQARDYHVELGRQVARAGIDVLITIGPLAERIAEGAAEAGDAGPEIRRYAKAGSAAGHVRNWLAAGDAVLVKGSRAVGAESVCHAIARVAGGIEQQGLSG